MRIDDGDDNGVENDGDDGVMEKGWRSRRKQTSGFNQSIKNDGNDVGGRDCLS